MRKKKAGDATNPYYSSPAPAKPANSLNTWPNGRIILVDKNQFLYIRHIERQKCGL